MYRKRKKKVQTLEAKTLAYWTLSQAARGVGKQMTVGSALHTTSDLMSAVGPHRKLFEVTAHLQQDLIDTGGAKKKRSSPKADVLKFKSQ